MTTTYAGKKKDNKSEAKTPAIAPASIAAAQVVDNRPLAVEQGDMNARANASPQVLQLKRFQEIADNSTQVKRLEVSQMMVNHAAGQPAIQLKNQVPLKDTGEATRTDGSGEVLSQAVATTISAKNLTDIQDTANALKKSIKNRNSAPVIGAEEIPGGHAHRIKLEEKLLKDLNAALITIGKEESQKSMAKANAQIAGMPDLGLKRSDTGGAWGRK